MRELVLHVSPGYEPPRSPSNRLRGRTKRRPHVWTSSPRGRECSRCLMRAAWDGATYDCTGLRTAARSNDESPAVDAARPSGTANTR